MFDTVLGLPIHPLVIHAVVIFGPLAAVTAIAYAVIPRLRRHLRWWVAGFALITAGTAYVAAESGAKLEARLVDQGLAGEALELVHTHIEAGDLAKWAAWSFAPIALVCVFGLLRPRVAGASWETPRRSPIQLVVSLIFIAASAALLYAVIRAGHTGAEAVWSGMIP